MSRHITKLSKLQLVIGLAIGLLPSPLKLLIYRWVYRYEIGHGVRIGFGSALIGVRSCRIGNGVHIGCGNLFLQTADLEIGDAARIGQLNLFRGGERIAIGSYATILRLNVCNSIPEPIAENALQAVLEIGAGSTLTTSHWIDFSDRVTIGVNSIIGGRGTSLWTHSRRRTRPVIIGAHCYLGAEVRIAPGVKIAPCTVVALGCVMLNSIEQPRSVVAGNPARVLRSLTDRDLRLCTDRNRDDIPDEVVLRWMAEVPPVSTPHAVGPIGPIEALRETV